MFVFTEQINSQLKYYFVTSQRAPLVLSYQWSFLDCTLIYIVISPFKGERPKREQGRNTKQFTLKELNPQDKKRVANLVKELAKVGEERVYAEEKLQEERIAFEERLTILQEEYDAVIKEKHRILSCYVNTKQSLDPE